MRNRQKPSPHFVGLHEASSFAAPTTKISLTVSLSFLVAILPINLARLFSFSSWLFKIKKKREILVVGSFLYKFEAGKLKGCPVSLEAIDGLKILSSSNSSSNTDEDNLVVWWNDMAGAPIVKVSTFDKSIYLRFASVEISDLFVSSVRERKNEVLKESLNHQHEGLGDDKIKRFDRDAQRLVERSLRIKKSVSRVEETELRVGDTIGLLS